MLRLLTACLLYVSLTAPAFSIDFEDNWDTFLEFCPNLLLPESRLDSDDPSLTTDTEIVWDRLRFSGTAGSFSTGINSDGLYVELEAADSYLVEFSPETPIHAVAIFGSYDGPVTFRVFDDEGALLEEIDIEPAGIGGMLWGAGEGQEAGSVEIITDGELATVRAILGADCGVGPENSLAQLASIEEELSILVEDSAGRDARRINRAIAAVSAIQNPEYWNSEGTIVVDGCAVFSGALDAVQSLGRVKGEAGEIVDLVIEDIILVLLDSTDLLIQQRTAEGADEGFLELADSIAGFAAELDYGSGANDRIAVVSLYYAWLFANCA